MLNERFDGSTIDKNKKGLARELSKNELNVKYLHPMVLENRSTELNEFFKT